MSDVPTSPMDADPPEKLGRAGHGGTPFGE